ncbi:unnamed protein product [Victoria cruziana]
MDDRREPNCSGREIHDLGGCEAVGIRMEQQPDCGARAVGKSSFTYWWNTIVWHGGAVYDAWLNAVAAQVGSLILTLPYTFSQMGYVFGVASQFLYGAFGCWTVYLLGLFHAEASMRTRDTGILHKRHILQVENVRHQGPKNMVDFFTGATNILFSFGSHGLCIELMEAMWRPKKYKYAYACAVLYTYLLTIPDSVAVYWAYGDVLHLRSNAFAVLPPSKMKNACIVCMILHQILSETEHARGRVMFFLSASVAVWVFIFGFGFGGWASMTKFVQQIQSFGFFDKCYQCPTEH